MTTLKAAVLVVLVVLTGCSGMPGPEDGGPGGGRAGGSAGGSVAGGSAGGAMGGGVAGGSVAGGSGGGATGGGVAGGSGGGAMMAFDAGRLDCTFEAPFDLGEGSANPRSQVAVLDTGETVYAWNDPAGVRWVVQSAAGVLGVAQTDTGNLAPGIGLVASGNRALLVYGKTTPELRARRYSNGTWSAGESVPPTPQGFASVFAALEPSGAASVWRQDTFAMTPYFEATTDGTSAFTQANVVDAGYLYATERANGTRLVIALSSFASLPEVRISSAGGETRTPLSSAVVGNDPYLAALADDGTAVIAGVFDGGTVGFGAMIRTGGTFSTPQVIGPSFRTLGALAGPGGRGAVIWFNNQVLLLSRWSGSTWTAPQSLDTTNTVLPRFSRTTASRGLVHYYDATGLPRRLEVTVDGVAGSPALSQLPGAVFGTEYAAAGTRGAAIATNFAPDGGYLIRASQCR